MGIDRTDALSGTGEQQTSELQETLQAELEVILSHSSTAVAVSGRRTHLRLLHQGGHHHAGLPGPPDEA